MIEMFETNSGGDYFIKDEVIQLDNSLKTICYISLFGGNLEESTEVNRKQRGALYKDFWGNCDVLNNEVEQFNSEFEKALAHTAINSGNLVEFEGAAEVDLQFLMQEDLVSSVQAIASILNPGELRIDIIINQPSNSEPETFSFLWKETLQRVEII